VNPNALYTLDTASTAQTPTVATTWTGGTGNNTAFAQFASYRCVAAGIKVSYTGSTTQDSGIIAMGQISGDYAPSGGAPAVNGQPVGNLTANSQYFKTYPLRQGGIVTWRPQEMDDQDVWLPTSTNSVATSALPTQPYLFATVYGAQAGGASSAIFEIVATFEGQYKNQGFLPGGISTEKVVPAEPGWYEKMRSIVNAVSPVRPLLGGTPVGTIASLGYSALNWSMRQRQSQAPQIGWVGPTVEEVD